MEYLNKLNGMSQGTLELVRRELRDNAQFAQHLNGLLEAPDPKKAVFEDMLKAVQLYIRGEELQYWYWWDLIDEIERFVDQEMYVPRPGDEGALLMRVLALKSIDAARAKIAHMNLPWKTFAKTRPTSGMSGGVHIFGLRTPDQRRKHHRHNRQRRLAAATPEEREAYLEGLAKRKQHRKDSTLASKFTEGFREYGGMIGGTLSSVGGAFVGFFPIGTIIGGALMVGGMAMTTAQQAELLRISAKAQEREMNKIQEDFETGEITADDHNEQIAAIMVEEGEILAAEGKLPPEGVSSEAPAAGTPTSTTPSGAPATTSVTTPTEPTIPATKENIVAVATGQVKIDPVKVPDAGDLVDKENQYIIDQSAKIEEPVAQETGLAPAQDIAKGQETVKTAGTAMIMAAGALPFILGR